MHSADIAKIISERTLQIHNIEKALRFTLVYLEGLALFEPIDQCEIIGAIAKIDKRFSRGQVQEIIFLDKDKFNLNGSVYIGKNKVQEIKKCKGKGILYIIKEVNS